MAIAVTSATREQPLVSVVTPSYNYARYLGRCLESVRSQSYGRIEHLVLDACSTDDSRAVIESFLGRYEMRAWFEKDRGQADALNKGFERARGEILCWLNADDYWLHDRVVERAVAALEGGADVVAATGTFVDEEGSATGPFLVDPAVMLPELRYYDTLLQPATFWRRSVHRPLHTDLHYAFDWQLWLEMRRGGARFAIRDEEWAAYRMHGVNKTAVDPARRKAEVARVLREELGARSPQCLWADLVSAAYSVAERRGSTHLKTVVRAANNALKILTRRRVFSC
jgi:glycosyltransferase involved in cell wall biosynthesis